MPQQQETTGVAFPVVDDRRSTITTGKAILEAALRPVDPIGADAVHLETAWRQGYVPHFKRLLLAGLHDPHEANLIAGSGLDAVHNLMVNARSDGDEPLSTALECPPGQELVTETVHGTRAPQTELTVPYRGQQLRGDELRRQVEQWVERGFMEPDVMHIVDRVLKNPDWLRLPDFTMVLIGGGAEMSPLFPLLRHGAAVAVVDRPGPGAWATLLQRVKQSAGTVQLPARNSHHVLPQRAGADLITELGAVTEWVAQLPGRLTLGNYVYADGAMNVRVATAVDVLTLQMLKTRNDTALAFLATPTDVFAVPEAVVHAATAAYERSKVRSVFRAPVKALSGGRLMRRNYVPDASPGVNDSVVVQQGPNYLLAKRIQRWRATVARSAGTNVAFSVAPPTSTRSVTKNSVLAAAYRGAHRFGIEVFSPNTATALMAACLVYDLYEGGNQQLPWQDEAHGAVHGGLWRSAYDPRSALGIAAMLGMATSGS